jgi:filamentous hemagglutinin family protein
MNAPLRSLQPGRREASLVLRPLVLALAGVLPLHSLAAGPVLPAPPAVNAVPQAPTVGWRVSGTGAVLPVNTGNAAGGVDQVINQTSASAIYKWNSFDIGAGSSVTFNFPSAGSSALNRVTGSASPSQIFGQLKAQYANPNGSGSLTGGTIYLINANGILFGPSAQVNVGGLIASTLDLQDSDYLSGLTQSITSTGYTFGAPTGTPVVPNNFVMVDPGAQITTASGGRVFLFANSLVQNGGTITTPGGQTVLAAGDQVYLNLPTNEKIYASEVNPNVPAVNGLLVEVGTGAGSVANIQGGVISTPTGNTTLVGMAVNQSGRISATTSVSQNGSVLLLARGSAQGGVGLNGPQVTKEATVAGTLTLGASGVVDIEPDTTPGANGQPATSSASSAFTPSFVALSGATIELQGKIVAPGGLVDARAATRPFYFDNTALTPTPYDYAAFGAPDDGARLVLDAGATIDVSGTTTTTVSAARNFVTTALLGANDLADAPLQRTGPIYRSELTFDVRSPVPILGDTSAYVNAIEKTATEKLAAGGSIRLASTGAVATHETSQLNVSGGAVNYTAATVTPSQLISSSGAIYTFNQAPANIPYAGILGSPTNQVSRWGTVPAYTPSQVTSGVVATAYTAGMAGGSLSVLSPVTVLDGQIQANVTSGVRQTSGLDAAPALAQLTFGTRTNGQNAFGSVDFSSAVQGDLNIVATRASLGSAFWSDPLVSPLPSASRIAAPTLNASGLGRITVTSNGNIVLQSGADLNLPTGASLDLASAGSAGIDIAANFSAAGGAFSAQTRSLHGDVGGVTLEVGKQLDVSAAWVNRALDGATAQAATSGGSVTLKSGGALDLQKGSRVDVSGGATVDVGGNVNGTAAGSIALQSNLSNYDGLTPSPVHIGAVLAGNSLVGGGALTVSADSITIGSQPLAQGVAQGPTTGSLLLSSQWFDQGAFTQYNVNALSSLVVTPGTTLNPRASNWVATAASASEPTGTKPASFLTTATLPDAQRLPASLVLSAASLVGNAQGNLTLSAGSAIKTDPLASVTLNAGLNLNVDGGITAPGGHVNLALVGTNQAENPVEGTLALGAQSVVDVSGRVVTQLPNGGLPMGQVLPGGAVTLGVSASAALTPIVIPAGAVINADGASAALGVTTTGATGGTTQSLQTVASAGGSVSIGAPAGALLAGNLHAVGGNASVSGGSFGLTTAAIVMQQAPVNASSPAVDANGQPISVVAVSAQSLGQGFSNVTLQASDKIRFNSDISLALAGQLTLDAPVLSASPAASQVSLSGASTLQIGSSYQQNPSAAGPIAGATQLSLQGGLVELFGQQVTQGFGAVAITSATELRLKSVTGAGPVQGSLGVQGNLTLSAQQIVPTTNTQYSFNAQGQQVLITGGNSSAAVPLSAGGSVTINATDINTVNPADASQYGVLRAPFGSLALNATGSIDIGPGSLLSVSGAGMTVPYGQTSGGQNWSYAGTPVSAPPQKSILLNAPGSAVTVATGATLDLSGGGNLLAQEFVSGNGGTHNIFAGAANGAFAVVPTITGYAPQDVDILNQQDASGHPASLQLGREIQFGAGGPIPAGTYAVLPAQYATLPGAFLVTPTKAGNPLALGASTAQTDGSVLMGGRYVEAGTGFGSSLSQSFKVMSSHQALSFSEIDQTNANTYFAARAVQTGTTVPALPTDAGTLAIVAGQLALQGKTSFALPTSTDAKGNTVTTGLGGELDIAADAIQVGGTAPEGVLSLSPATLNATGAALVVLGGRRDAAGGSLSTSAGSVTVDNAGQPLQLADLVLTANNAVSLQAGAAIQAPAAAGSGSAPLLTVTGDGALLRVSSDPSAVVTRTGALGQNGALSIGSGVALSGGAITADGTLTNTIAGDAKLAAQAITLGAGHVAVGQVDQSLLGADTLALTPTLAAQVAGAQSLTLRSATGIDLYGSAVLGGASVRSLTLDTGTINLVDPAAGAGTNTNTTTPPTATIVAGGVTLTNTTGATGGAGATGSDQLQIKAVGTGSNGSGQVVIGPGAVAITGAASTTLVAQREVVLGDTAALSTSGDLGIQAAALQAKQGASASLEVSGNFSLASNGQASATTAGLGAHVSISAATLDQGGQVLLPSGQLTLNATGASAPDATALHFETGSLTDLSGRSSTIDSVTVATPGGVLSLNAPAGNVSIDTGALVNVSAPSAGGPAGSIVISAPTGAVTLQGRLLGTAAPGQGGGSLSVDSSAALDLGALAATLNAASNNFTGALNLRNRSGDQQLAAGTSLAAQNIQLSADNGTLTIAGSLDASGASGTAVALSGGVGLDLESTAEITAHSTGSVGSRVELASGNLQAQTNGSFVGSVGSIKLNGGVIDTTAAAGGVNGRVLLRAQRTSSGTSVAIGGSGGTRVLGTAPGGIVVEAVKQYNGSTVNSTLITKINADDQTLGGKNGSNAATVLAQVGALLGQPASAMQLRAGVEVDSTGDLTVVGNTTAGGWNLTQFAANGAPQAQATGAPVELSLRAAGNLYITGSISDGFMPSGATPTTATAAGKIAPAAVVAQIGGQYAQGADIRLVGGADLSAANPMSTLASTSRGDVVIGAAGKNVLVRTTTGNIDIAAGRDVTLLNTLADVYTTGTPVPIASLPGYAGNVLGNGAYLASGAAKQSPFLSGGGSLSVNAGRDIVGVDPSTATLQYATEWAWRASDSKGQLLWWNRYDQFQQGFATLGGGNVTAFAQRDLVNADFSAAASGFSNPGNGTLYTVGGGDLNVQAGRDVLGGFVLAAGNTGTVRAGRDIAAGTAPNALQVLYGDTAIGISAVNNLDLGLVSAFGMVPATKQYSQTPPNSFLMGLTPDATLQVQAASGDLRYEASSPLDSSSTRAAGASTTADRIIPDSASFVAPNGSITAGTLIQDPAGTTRLDLLALDNLTVTDISVNGTDSRSSVPTLLAGSYIDQLNRVQFQSPTPWDTGVRTPMRLVAETGDLAVGYGIETTTQLRMIAGRDVVLGSSDSSVAFDAITIQHQSPGETSLIQAGRDIVFPADDGGTSGGVQLYGPGNLLVLAGRDIDLSTSGGLRAIGNRQNSNPNFPAGSGNITVEAGVSLTSGDYSQAVAWYFPLLGGAGIASYAGDLAAQLIALQAGQPLPAPGSAAAGQFNAQSVASQVSQVQTLVGAAVFNAAVLADAQRRAPGTQPTLAQAQSSFAALSASDQQTVLDAVLANAWLAALPAAQQQAQVLAMAQAAKSPYLAQLQQFMATQGQQPGVSAAQALSAFEALAPESQVLFTNQVLVDVIRQAGRTASALKGSAQTAAYAPGYAALDLVFPTGSTATGTLSMGASQIQTLQNSSISVLAPRGDIDVGTVATGLFPKPAYVLGIVTADGGDISAVVSGSVNVDQSRVFTVGQGNLLMWASNGSLDAGRGGKTVVGAPAPVYYLDSTGHFVIDTSGSFSGSGIAVLNADSTLDLYAPKGEINAGDAGIKSLGNAFFGAASFVGADNLSVSGVSVGAPPPASTGGETAGLASVGQAATSAGTRIDAGDSDAEKERKRRKRLNLILDFLGFGDGSSKS